MNASLSKVLAVRLVVLEVDIWHECMRSNYIIQGLSTSFWTYAMYSIFFCSSDDDDDGGGGGGDGDDDDDDGDDHDHDHDHDDDDDDDE